ncbi:Transcription factor LHW [Morella rubra]|uniref:Transcription factor LHW n=1 Tax=Morella rubra TaxID=262757 RepID=A0A6A1VRJ3_9ROSI|nr:Transcription factor LHW [Morella rubra]
MGAAETGSVLKKTLKSLCRSYGWSYGVFWRFVQRGSLLLTFEDAYCEEQVGAVVDMLPQIHMTGEGVIGQAAFSGKHRWMFADAYGEVWDSAGSFERKDIFQDDSEFLFQFSSGIKTIAVISVAPQGVVQFGSTQKILEKLEFLDQTKRLFQEMKNVDGLVPLENALSTCNNENYVLNGLFASSISSGNSYTGDLNAIYDDSRKELLGEACSETITKESSHSIFGIHGERMTRDPDNQLQACGTETQVLLSDKLSTQFQQTLLQSTSSVSTRSSEDSILTLFDPLLASETKVLHSSKLYTSKVNTLESCRNIASNVQEDGVSQHSFPSIVETRGEVPGTGTSMHRFTKEFKSEDFSPEVPEFYLADDLFQWFSPSPDNSINRMAAALANNLSQPMGVTSASSSLVGDDGFNHFPSKYPGNSVQCSITKTFNPNEQENSVVMMNDAENDLFNGFGLDFGYCQSGDCFEDLIPPVKSATADTGMSECMPELDVGSMAGPRKGLFSELGLQEILDGISNAHSSAKLEDQISNNKRSRVDSSSVNSNQLQLASFACSSGSLSRMQPGYNLDKKSNFPKKEVLPKSQVGLWIDDSYSINSGNAGLARPQKPLEPAKATRKRAKPGESTRPRPKDRQQIQDRIKELRGIIPHGGKCSIDSLLDRTIKYMLFLQSVTKYADRLKQSDEPKLIGQETGVVLKDNNMGGGSGGTTWAFEVGSQTMVCPIIVEDLNPPGQMLVEMLCEEQGFFLEIADVIRGFQLNILKGVMEAREDKIWARFIVEASSHVTRIDIFLSLVQLLKQTTTSSNDATSQPGNIIDGVGIPLVDSYQQPNLLRPMSLAETLGC